MVENLSLSAIGNFPKDWAETTLSEVCVQVTDGTHDSPKESSDGFPLVTGKSIKGRRIDFTIPYNISKDDHLKVISRSKPECDDILFANIGNSIGDLVRVETDREFSIKNVALFKPNKEVITPRYLEYFLFSPVVQSFVKNTTKGSAQPFIGLNSLRGLPIALPPLTDQKFIAHILGTLDDKIELNRQMNATLEAMAQALFKSWFVDFGPVIDNALAAGNPIPDPLHARAEVRKALGNQRKPLPESIQNQFPNSFVFNEDMGWVPEGWGEVQIKEIAKIIKGKSYKSSELEESKTALVTLKSFKRGGGYRLDGLKEYTGSYKPEQEVFAGDLIIAYTDVTQAADVIGKPAMVVSDSRYDHLVISLDVAVVRPKVSAYKYFLYGIAQTGRFQDHTYSHSTGTTVLHLGKNAVPDYFVSIPDEKLITAFVKIAEPSFNLIDKQIAEMKQLSILRDTLLPKLLSGQLRIPDAEKQVADAI